MFPLAVIFVAGRKILESATFDRSDADVLLGRL